MYTTPVREGDDRGMTLHEVHHGSPPAAHPDRFASDGAAHLPSCPTVLVSTGAMKLSTLVGMTARLPQISMTLDETLQASLVTKPAGSVEHRNASNLARCTDEW